MKGYHVHFFYRLAANNTCLILETNEILLRAILLAFYARYLLSYAVHPANQSQSNSPTLQFPPLRLRKRHICLPSQPQQLVPISHYLARLNPLVPQHMFLLFVVTSRRHLPHDPHEHWHRIFGQICLRMACQACEQ